MDAEVRVRVEIVLSRKTKGTARAAMRGADGERRLCCLSVCTRTRFVVSALLLPLLSCPRTSADVLSFISLRLTSGAGAAAAAGADMAGGGAWLGSVRRAAAGR